jgi:hypothetical protein
MQQPQGIMASSQPLVDAIVADAINPQGGSTLSEDDGTLSMARGGAVGFANGGLNSEQLMARRFGALNMTDVESLQRPTQLEFQQYRNLYGKADLARRKALDAVRPTENLLAPFINTFRMTRPEMDRDAAERKAEFDRRTIEYERIKQIPLDQWISDQGGSDKARAWFSNPENVSSMGSFTGTSVDTPVDPNRFANESAMLGAYEEAEGAMGAGPSVNIREAIEPGGQYTEEQLGLLDKAYEGGEGAEPPDDGTWTDAQLDLLEDAYAGGEAPKPPEAPEAPEAPEPPEAIPFQGSTDYGALTKYLAGGGQEDAPADVVNKAADDIFSTALRAAKGEKFDAEALKKEIDALLPRTKGDPEMEGLLLAMVGAAIMGGESPDAWTNIGQGVTKSLPALINFKGKQAEAERAREMTVAKLAIETKLSRETENRANIRGIEKEQRAGTTAERVAARKDADLIRKENRITKMYTVLKDATIPMNSIDPEAPEGEMFKVPALMTFPLNKASAQRLSGLGVSIASGVKIDYDDIVTANTKVSGISGLTLKQMNALTENQKMTVFKFGTSPGAQIWFRTPKESGVRTGYATQDAMQSGMWKKLYSAYKSYQDPLIVLYSRFDTLKQYVNADGSLSDDGKSKVTGYNVIKERIGDKLKGMGFGWSKNLGTALLGGKKQSTISKFEAEARIVLAQIAPLYLGESGRTISDADRIRVALALGFKVDQDLAGQANPILKITGFDDAFFTNPDAIVNALNVTQGIVKKYIDQGNGEMAGYLNQFARVLDTDPKLRRTIPKPSDFLVFNATI